MPGLTILNSIKQLIAYVATYTLLKRKYENIHTCTNEKHCLTQQHTLIHTNVIGNLTCINTHIQNLMYLKEHCNWKIIVII